MLSPESQRASCADELRKRYLVKSRAIRREYCARRRKDVDILDILKEQEVILRELTRATRDVLMLRLSKIRVEKTMTQTAYDQIGDATWHRRIVENMGGEMVTVTKVIIQAYYRT